MKASNLTFSQDMGRKLKLKVKYHAIECTLMDIWEVLIRGWLFFPNADTDYWRAQKADAFKMCMCVCIYTQLWGDNDTEESA